MGEVVLASALTCPECGRVEALEMPRDACVWFHECAGCGAMLRP